MAEKVHDLADLVALIKPLKMEREGLWLDIFPTVNKRTPQETEVIGERGKQMGLFSVIHIGGNFILFRLL